MDYSTPILIGEARSRILQDPSLTGYQQVQALGAIQQAAIQAPAETPHLTVMDVVRGAIGAGIGYGAANILGRFLGASDETVDKMRTIGAGLGTMLNTGLLKISEERDARNAFRIGFLKQCHALGLFEKDAAMVPVMLPITPGTFLEPMRAGYGLFNQAVGAAGAGAAAADAPSKTDEALTQMQLERAALDRQAARIEALRRNRLLGEILRKRMAA
jgi:hypothetical protein